MALRIGLVGPVPPPNGGMAMQTRQLGQLLSAEGIFVEHLATNAPYRPRFIASIPGVRALIRLVPYFFGVLRLSRRVDVIHLMSNSGWSWQLFSAPVLWLASLSRTPVVVNYRGGEAGQYFRQSFRRVKPSLDRASAVIVPSGYLRGVFDEFGVATQVIPNIVDTRVFKPGNERPPQEFFTLAIARNLEAIYGIDTAIEAVAVARDRGATIRLRIAGSGPQKSELEGLVEKLGVGELVSFEGRLERDGMVALYHQSDAMLNPTTIDNMPNSVIEALACGLPVISTDVGGVPFIVTHESTALLVPASNPRAMADAMIRLAGDVPLRQQLRGNGLQVIEQYTWDCVKTQWMVLYKHLKDGV
tara:strand:- start:37615 stop:38691 length:1077 start_codon:yes stop_codon:yes gene_type:complete